jgi:hypothetical protein
VTYTLVADGTSDRVLLPILTWSLNQQQVTPVVSRWVDFGRIPHQESTEDRCKAALELYPCDVLFVHRDAEAQPSHFRRQEIANALRWTLVRHIPVIPVRMTEAWLLADEQAIRSAAGNPNGRENLYLPDIRRLEDLPDPKRVLHNALTAAGGRNARRRSFSVGERVHRIPTYIDDYSCLNVLPAFQTLQLDIRSLIENFI